ncbi:MAG: RICIN domain-containing protein [Nocardioidaceae bacterium]
MTARRIAVLAFTLGVLAASQLVLPSAPASAGTVGVAGVIQGAGSISSVEGGPYHCERTGNQDDRATVSCDREPFEAVFEAWVWLKATPASWPTGRWSFAGWSGCDETRVVNGNTQCAVHSGAISLDERRPKAFFVSNTQVKEVRPQHSAALNMCLDVAHASREHAAPVVQGTCWGGANQKWTTRPVGGGYYEIRPQHSAALNMCLDVAHASREHAAPVVQGTCWGGLNQQWQLRDNRNGSFEIVAGHSRMCLDVKDASRQHAAQVVQATCSGGTNQRWRFQ